MWSRVLCCQGCLSRQRRVATPFGNSFRRRTFGQAKGRLSRYEFACYFIVTFAKTINIERSTSGRTQPLL